MRLRVRQNFLSLYGVYGCICISEIVYVYEFVFVYVSECAYVPVCMCVYVFVKVCIRIYI